MKQLTKLSDKEKEYFLSGKVKLKPLTIFLSCIVSIVGQTVMLYRQIDYAAKKCQILLLVFSALAIIIILFTTVAFKRQRMICNTIFALLTFFEPIPLIVSYSVHRGEKLLVPLSATVIISFLLAFWTIKDTVAKLDQKKLSPKMYTIIGGTCGIIGFWASRAISHFFGNIKLAMVTICGVFLFSFLFFYVLFYLLKQIVACKQEFV